MAPPSESWQDVQAALETLGTGVLGTRKEQWARLTGRDQLLWRFCQAAVATETTQELDTLCSWQGDEGARTFVCHEYGEGSWQGLWGLVACAEVAVRARRLDIEGLQTWAARAVALCGGIAVPAPASSPEWPQSGVESAGIIRALYTALRQQGGRIGAARDLTLALLGIAPRAEDEITSLRLGVLGYQRTGFVATLVLERLPEGGGDFYPEPQTMGFARLTASFRNALETAWRYTQGQTPSALPWDVRWRYEGPPLRELDGASIGAAAAVGLRCLLEGKPCQPKLAITGGLDETGKLLPVEHVREKVAAAVQAHFETIIVPRENEAEARAGAPTFEGIRTAGTVEEAVEIASGLIAEVMRYLEMVQESARSVRVLPQSKVLPLEQIYIPVKVSQRRIGNLAEDRAAEGGRLRGKPRRGSYAFAYLSAVDEDDLGEQRDTEEEKEEVEEEGMVLRWEEARRDFSRVVVLGDPGQGKSTLLRWEAWKVATDALKKLRRQEVGLTEIEMPLHFRLAEVAHSGRGILTYLKDSLAARNFSPTFCAWIEERCLKRGRAVLLLDALDEVFDAEQRAVVKRELEVLLHSSFQHCRYLLTSRIVGYDGCAVEERGKVLQLALFRRQEVEKFVGAWFGEDRNTRHEFIRAFRVTRALKRLARNPLMLSLLCAVFRPKDVLPERVTDLYTKCVWNFLVDWRRWRGQAASEAWARLKLTMLEEVALELLVTGREYFSFQELFDALNHVLRGLVEKDPGYRLLCDALVAKQPEENLLHELTVEDGILVKAGAAEGAVPYMFVHLTIQEYLAASALARRKDWPKTVERWLAGAWEMRATVLVFLAGVLRDATPLIELLLAHDDQRPLDMAVRKRRVGKDPFGNVLVLASRCAAESRALKQGFHSKIYKSAMHRFCDKGSRNEVLRERGGECLAWLGGIHPRAFEPLLTALRGEDRLLKLTAAWILGEVGDGRIVVSLIEALHHDQEKGFRDAVVSALHQVTDSRALEPLLEALRDTVEEVREEAARALGLLGDQRAVEPLLKVALHDKDVDVIQAASHSLGQLGDTSVVAPSLEALRSKRSWIARFAATAILRDVPDSSALRPLIEALRDKNRNVRWTAADALGELGDPLAVDGLIEALGDKDLHVRWAVSLALGKLGDPQAVESLIRVLQHDKAPEVRRAAALALRKFGERRAFGALLEALHDEDYRVRALAVMAVNEGNVHLAKDSLLDLILRGDTRTVLWGVTRRLRPVADRAVVKRLLQALHDERREVRAAAAAVLMWLRERSVVEPLFKLLEDEQSMEIRELAAEALGHLRDKRAVGPLLKSLANSWAPVRRAAVWALGEIIDARAIPALRRRALNDEAWGVRSHAAESLGRLGDTHALIRQLRDENGKVRVAAAMALRQMGDRRAVTPLCKTLRDSWGDVRIAAFEALENIDRRMREGRERLKK